MINTKRMLVNRLFHFAKKEYKYHIEYFIENKESYSKEETEKYFEGMAYHVFMSYRDEFAQGLEMSNEAFKNLAEKIFFSTMIN